MRAISLIGGGILILALGIILRVNAGDWSTRRIPVDEHGAPGQVFQLIPQPTLDATYTDSGNAFALVGLIAFAIGTYGWMMEPRSASR